MAGSDRDGKDGVEDDLDRYDRENAELKRMLKHSKALGDTRLNRIVNGFLFIAIVVLFLAQMTFKPLPNLMSLEIGLFLISIKLILMIETAARFNHFQFWILHTIERRIESVVERLDEMENK